MASEKVSVVIVGAGFSGLCAGVLLRKAGIDSFVILEKGDDVGGTWRENTYPGAACDIPSLLYSYSFEPNPGWSRAYSPQEEILAYLRRCADKYGLRSQLRTGTRVLRASFDEARALWRVECANGVSFEARALLLGNGGLHVPLLPAIPGRERFGGAAFHSAQWDHSVELKGKRIGVIGTGASSIQFVPRIAPDAGRLTLFQRTPAWVIPKEDRPFSDDERRDFSDQPWLQRLRRNATYWGLEWQVLLFERPRLMALAERLARAHLARQVADEELRKKLTPDYRMGCKRILLSDDFYPAVSRPNVEVVTDGIAEITEQGVRTRDGGHRALDVLIYGTGFDVRHYLSHIELFGLGGKKLDDVWSDSPDTYLGITVSGFPNMFLMMGPNTGLGHNSMIFMIEAQAGYAVQAIKTLLAKDVALDVKPDVQRAYNDELQKKMADTVWQRGGCISWYQAETGRNVALWPGSTFSYWRLTRRLKLDDYIERRATKP